MYQINFTFVGTYEFMFKWLLLVRAEEEEAGARRRELLSSTLVRRAPGDSARLSDAEQLKLRVCVRV